MVNVPNIVQFRSSLGHVILSRGVQLLAGPIRTQELVEVLKALLQWPTSEAYEVENGQLIKALFKYVQDHPEIAHRSTSVLLVEALQQAFPC